MLAKTALDICGEFCVAARAASESEGIRIMSATLPEIRHPYVKYIPEGASETNVSRITYFFN